MCDAVAGAINAILSVYEGLIQGALALAQAVVTGDWGTFLLMALESALKLAGINPDEFYALVGKAEDTITFILENPGTFLGNCISAVGQGFGQFSDNFLKHLQAGFVDWLTGQAGDTGITMPDTLDLAGVMDIVMQVLGIGKDKLREKAVEHLGEENVERFEFVWGFIESAISGGLAGLNGSTPKSTSTAYGIWPSAPFKWLTQKIIVAAVTKIASMFNPVGAIVQALLTAWDLYCWVKEEIARIMGVVNAVVNGLADIAMGNIGGAANAVEQALADLVPTAINLLANILGLGGIGAKVREIIEGIQETVDQAIDNMIEKVKGFFKGDGKSSDSAEDSSAEETSAEGEGEAKGEEESEEEEDRSAPKLSGSYQTTQFQYAHESDMNGIQFADISINGSYQLEVIDESALKSNYAMGDGYDNQGISSVAKSAIQVALTNVIANSKLPIVDVLMASNYSRFQSEALSIASGRVSRSSEKITTFDIEYINGNGYESQIDAATAEAISKHAAGPPPSGWDKKVVAKVASEKAVL